MALSWNEIRTRAVTFSKEWENESSEDAEAKSFLDGFFNVFGVNRRRVAYFEKKVKKIGGKDGYIDVLWPGVILIEQKSKGQNLDKAYTQAKDYFPGLTDTQLPKYILVSDFERFTLYELEEDKQYEFNLRDLYKNVKHFGFIAGYQKQEFKPEDPVNIKAAELMGKLHDMLKNVGYTGHQLEVYLVRILFCLFADDTTIFDKGIFEDYLRATNEDGTDLADRIAGLFEILNTPESARLRNIDETLNAFPYVNGKLFEENLSRTSFDSNMRNILLECSALNWGKISPAIFGSMFQSVMNPKERRNIGAHYTSEKNILKLIRPLFLDELWAEFSKVKSTRGKLVEFHKKLSTLKFLDPACGCGNFLVITYRELRRLEIEVLRSLYKDRGSQIIVENAIWLDVDQFYGIEFEDWPAQIAQVAMWLMDHQMNMQISEQFGEYFRRLPLKKSATIVCDNALRIDWQSLLNKENALNVYAENAHIFKVEEPKVEYNTVNVYAKNVKFKKAGSDKQEREVRFNYILGNPPFIGKQYQTESQRLDSEIIFSGVDGAGVLDYVAGWYIKAAQYIEGSKVKAAFVSTNSISQGEQVGILWRELYNRYGIKIHFAHRTFRWNNEAKGKAAVHVVIIGFASFDIPNKSIFEYETIAGEPHEINVKNINPYLVQGKDLFLKKRRSPICNVQKMVKGSMPNDGGYYLFNEGELHSFLETEPEASKYIRAFIGGHEFINGIKRYCLWLANANPSVVKNLKSVYRRIELVKEYRLKSQRQTTLKDAERPMLFGEIRQHDTDYLALPEVSSERRKYIPIGFIKKDVIASNKIYTISNASHYSFAILSSIMHMAWVSQVSGRLKSDFGYSTGIVYNNYPWPENPSAKQKEAVEKAAQGVLDVRAQFPGSSLADLYDPLTMPPALVKAHQELDKAVDKCYRPAPFESETKRIEYLFELYEKYTAGLFAAEGKKKRNK